MSDLVVGEVRGYRAWLPSGGALRALSGLHIWQWASEEATCLVSGTARVDHPAPYAGCTCGLYAYYQATTVRPYVGQVFGVVAVTGRVILATRGMKAERMTILALATDDAWLVECLGQWYGVPIYPTREALLEDYPPQDYGELVNVDPCDPPGLPMGGPPATVLVDTGFVAGLRTAAGQMVERVVRLLPAQLLPARVVATRVMAARVGVTVARARRCFRELSAADQAELAALAREQWRTRSR